MSRFAINHREHHKKVFEEVLDYYTDLRVSHGTNQSRDYEQMASNGPPGEGRNSKLVRPTISDFLADVELCAKRALSISLFAQFSAVFVDQIISFDTVSAEDRATIEEQMGKMLIYRRMTPLSLYFRAKDLR